MTIQEAIKSKKPFRREGESQWYILWTITSDDGERTPYALGRAGESFNDFFNRHPSLTDVLAEDWQIKQ